jgi:hypothetical protein
MNFYAVNQTCLDQNCLLARLLWAELQRGARMSFLIETRGRDHHKLIVEAA